jgi:hypothetical protein
MSRQAVALLRQTYSLRRSPKCSQGVIVKGYTVPVTPGLTRKRAPVENVMDLGM